MTPQQANELLTPQRYEFTSPTWCGSSLPADHEEDPDGEYVLLADVQEAIDFWNRRSPAPTEPAVDRDAVLEEAACLCVTAFDKSGAVAFLSAAKEIRALKLATPASPAVPEQPVAWFEADPSAKGLPLREVIGGMVHSTRFHSTKPEVLNNALWPLYEHPAPQVAQASQPTSAEGKDSERLEGGAALYAALSALVESLAQSDDEGLIEHAPEMVNARKALCGSAQSLADPRVDDLAMLTRQLVRALSKAAPNHDLPAKALDYLKRKCLQGSPLRDGGA